MFVFQNLIERILKDLSKNIRFIKLLHLLSSYCAVLHTHPPPLQCLARAIGGKLDITLDDIPALVVFKNGHMIKTIKHVTKAMMYDTDYPTEAFTLERNLKPL